MKNKFKHAGAVFLSLCALMSTSCDNGPWGKSDLYKPIGTASGYYPEEFVTEGKTYRPNALAEVTEECIDKFYGYLVNEFQLEKVKEFETDESVIYIVDPNNSVVGGGLPDHISRLSVYTIKNSSDLALYLKPIYIQCVLEEPDKMGSNSF